VHPGAIAADRPEGVAVVQSRTGAVVTYAQLEAASNRLAHLFRERGLVPGDHLAVFLDNDPRYFEVVWAGIRAGLYVTPINWHLGPDEAGYIIDDCDAVALVTTAAFADVVRGLGRWLDRVVTQISLDGGIDGFERYDDLVVDVPAVPIDDESEGTWMFYSSGTTGHPKGILPPLPGGRLGTPPALAMLMQTLYGFDDTSVYLSPAPLYHAAPLGWSICTQRLGGTVVLMERFDPEAVLAAIERYRVTHVQFVPTHFIRMLKLPEEVRQRYDLSSLRAVIHAAAPCPVEVKRRVIEWLGPIVYEYYAGSEGTSFVAVDSEEWLAHPGTVGRPMLGTPHILDDHGDELGEGDVGQIWFESPVRFSYHKDPAKTAEAFNERGLTTIGDMGYVDGDGYLYLTDRVSHMIISGGVNIYPQEVENLLSLHPAVADVAVIGVPDEDMGESVLAVVQPASPGLATPETARELVAHCREHLAGFKCPRSVDFVDELPRLPTGKLLKRVLRERYAASDG